MIPATLLTTCPAPLPPRAVDIELAPAEEMGTFDLRVETDPDRTKQIAVPDAVQLPSAALFWSPLDLPQPAQGLAGGPVEAAVGRLGATTIAAAAEPTSAVHDQAPTAGPPAQPDVPIPKGAEGLDVLPEPQQAEISVSVSPDASEQAEAASRPAPQGQTAQVAETLRALLRPLAETEDDRASPDLGPVDLEIRTEAEAVFVTLRAERSETLDLFRRHAAELMEELRAAGFAQATVEIAARRELEAAPGQSMGEDGSDGAPPRYANRLALSGGVDMRI